MSYTTLIATNELDQNFDDPNCVVIDCRLQQKALDYRRRAYEQAHIAGAPAAQAFKAIAQGVAAKISAQILKLMTQENIIPIQMIG